MSLTISSDNGPVDTSKGLWAKMMGATEYSDFVIKCRSKTFHVHRIIVCTQSRPIQAAANGNFKVSPHFFDLFDTFNCQLMNESITGILELEDDDPSTVARMISFFYLQDYDDSETSEEINNGGSGRLLINAMVYIIGDKYDIQLLKMLAKKKYEAALLTDWHNASFSASLELLYEELPESDTCLTSVALHAAGEHVQELKNDGEFARMCKSNPVIAYDLFTTMASQSSAMTIPPPKTQSQPQSQPQNKEACPKGHGFLHLKDVHAMYDVEAGKWRVKCPNCAVQKVCYRRDNSCDVEARWDGGGVGFWFL